MIFFELVPNRSLTVRSAVLSFLLIVAPPLAISTVFALAGYWPILWVAGLEVAAVGLAMWWTLRKAQARELIQIDERNILIRKHYPDHDEQHEMSRYWTQVRLIRPKSRHWPSRLTLRSKGRSVEVGTFLTDEERDGLERRLSEVIAAGR